MKVESSPAWASWFAGSDIRVLRMDCTFNVGISWDLNCWSRISDCHDGRIFSQFHHVLGSFFSLTRCHGGAGRLSSTRPPFALIFLDIFGVGDG